MATDAWGIDDEYEDALRHLRKISPLTREKIRAAIEIDPALAAPADSPVCVLTPRRRLPKLGPGQLLLEDGTRLDVAGRLPADLPLGYHDFFPGRAGPPVRLIVSPGQCPLPARSLWGWATQLYATRSKSSWGIGDFADLRQLGHWSASLGAGILLVNPLGAAAPALPQTASPYYASSRRYYNPLYLRIEEVPGFTSVAGELAATADAARALNHDRHIHRDAIFRLKFEALEKLWQRFAGHASFDQYCQLQGHALLEYATYSALAQTFGSAWRQWPTKYRRPEDPAVAQFAAEHADRVAFHQWLQWLLDGQLARAAAELPIMQDLPIGADPEGADAWAWQDVLADGVSVGAPPDLFNTQGQNWGLPPFVPHKLRAARYEPFIQCIRAALRHAGGLRIDHILGFFRLFWIPHGSHPREGAFVRYRADELLAILAIESHRAGALVIGEDLGTLERGVRRKLAERHILSYRLLWFEKRPPAKYPELSLSAVTTHDLPTVAGIWTLSDLAARNLLNLAPNETAERQIRDRLRKVAGLSNDAPVEKAIEAAYRLLAESPSLVLSATLEDVLAVSERPNMPNTTTQWPNWSLALPKPLEELEQAPLARTLAALLSRS